MPNVFISFNFILNLKFHPIAVQFETIANFHPVA